MFKVKNEVFNNQYFFQALATLAQKQLPVKVSWNIKRLMDQCAKAEKEVRTAVAALGEKYFKKNDDGFYTPVVENGKVKPNHFETINEGDQEKFNEEFKELMDIEITLESYKIKLDDIESIDLPASQLSALELILTDGEEGLKVVD